MCKSCYEKSKSEGNNEPYWKFINRPATMIGVIKRFIRLGRYPNNIINKYLAEIEQDEIQEFKNLHNQLWPNLSL